MLNSFLVPPRNAENASQPEPEKTLSEILSEEADHTRRQALQDIINYSVSNAVDGTDINVLKAVNARHFLAWEVIKKMIAEAKPYIDAGIKKAQSERDKSEQQRVEFENLASLFESLNLQIQTDGNGYTLTGLTERHLRLFADILAGADE
jgi:hypothetical protein